MKTFLQKYIPYITTGQAKGIFALLFLLVVTKALWIYYYTNAKATIKTNYDIAQTQLIQRKIDSIQAQIKEEKQKIQPFNPNFITDYRGMQLGMSTKQIDLLHQYRKTGKYINSAKEFQKITQVSDQWLEEYSPYFKFPEWVTNKKESKTIYHNTQPQYSPSTKDINKATIEDLKSIRGIGDVLAQRIIDEREKLGSFVSIQQIEYIKNISPEAIREIKKTFRITTKKINKINANTASIEQLTTVPYLNSYLARQIVIMRSKQTEPIQKSDLTKIKNFPIEKIEIIALYLEF